MKRVPWGVMFFGVILVLTSLWQIHLIPHYAKYKMINHDVPEGIMAFRYAVSYVLRLAGLVCGVGILFHVNICRKGLIFLFIFSILTLPLRHTYSSFYIYVKPLFNASGVSLVSLEVFTWMNVVCRWILDGIFAAAGIYYFTRPKVTAYFNASLKNVPSIWN
ncbi:MAG: hypothetical protein WCI27_07785 [Candidatus Omnitrophota bacterium]